MVHVGYAAAIVWVEEALGIRKTTHIHILYHFVKDIVGSSHVELVNMKLENNIANMFTKPLCKTIEVRRE